MYKNVGQGLNNKKLPTYRHLVKNTTIDGLQQDNDRNEVSQLK
jgi:hypothetical protein